MRGKFMKKTALLAAAAALFVATPAMAQSAGGYVGLNYGNTEIGDDEADTIQIDAAIGGNHSPVGFQFDVGYGQTEIDSGGDFDHVTLAGHVYWNTENFRLGAVVVNSSLSEDDAADVDEIAYGIEGGIDIGSNFVLSGSYTWGETEFLVDLDTTNLDIGGAFYISDNFRIGGTVGAGTLDAGGGSDEVDTTTIGLNAEYQLSGMPLSFRASYDSFDADDTLTDSVDTFKLGARWAFGLGTLRERDAATPFDTRAPLFQRLYGFN
jgi:long-subunit fatty acid transport protein